MALWGIPFALVGVYLIIGPFFADAYLRARARYAVTDQRALIVTNLWNRQVKSVSLRTLREIFAAGACRWQWLHNVWLGTTPQFDRTVGLAGHTPKRGACVRVREGCTERL